ncbi:hypothetical protein BV22DRAFT_1041629 [Leucogyrophana mollusca]|uniref:Uncharacterized protein n=1 Tax=Leucogyrophana mollusca TaxID=85980 RepID=A0ACB8AZD1_9AGAM|nr:hypothetical protein BV22DRAFT_1041629 [Leucogyrophana mollusca]
MLVYYLDTHIRVLCTLPARLEITPSVADSTRLYPNARTPTPKNTPYRQTGTPPRRKQRAYVIQFMRESHVLCLLLMRWSAAGWDEKAESV